VSSGPSLYRRHRPRTFDDVVGQEAVVRTLRNAVERGQVHHAYLFVGSRGTGKTSMAKILASCLNCEQGPTIKPCGVCDSCRAIASATSLDVIEMDAASNNSVDDIRELRESVAYAPVSGRHKVYILDEAHMLSPQAWNAFLKTLEEPPPNTIFVLATTEAQKVLPTVIDRCHRFDFARPTVEQIAGVLRRTAEAEDIEIPSQAVALIARAATGSFRDALGTLEQLVTYSGTRVELADVVAVLGVADGELLHEALEAVAASDARSALLTVARGVESGRDAAGLIRDLEIHARELLVVRTLSGEVPVELSVTPDADARLAAQAARLERGDLVRLLDLLAGALEAVKAGADARTQLELALVKAATPEVDASTRALLARLQRLESALAAAPPAEPESSAQPPAQQVERASRVPPARPAEPSAEPAQPASPAARVIAPRAEAGGAAATAMAAPLAEPDPTEQVEPETQPAPAMAALPALDLDAVLAIWPAVIESVQAERPLLAAVITEARPTALEGSELLLAFSPSDAFLKRKAEDQDNRMAVAEALRVVTGHALRLAYETREADTVAMPAPAPTEEEWVARFVSEFDAEEIPVDVAPVEATPTEPTERTEVAAGAGPSSSGDAKPRSRED
jgi:DNA polymerase III subunit gamma/tau